MKIIYEDEDYSLRPAHPLWGFIYSLIKKNPQPMNFILQDKKVGSNFRLTNREQAALGNVAELMNAFWFTPEMQGVAKSSEERWRRAINRECIDAVIASRIGNDEPLENFTSMKLGEFAMRYPAPDNGYRADG
ncbi:MAG: hypothetical protein ACE1Z4_03850 [Gammaproteobacteria bacterium]